MRRYFTLHSSHASVLFSYSEKLQKIKHIAIKHKIKHIVSKWNPANLILHKNQLWYIFAENVITIMRYVPEIQFGAGNVDIESCTRNVLRDLLCLMHDKHTSQTMNVLTLFE